MLHAQLPLQLMTAAGHDRRHPMRDHHRAMRDAVDVREQMRGRLGHHDDRRTPVGDAAHDLADLRFRLRQHRVQGGDDRLVQLLEQGHAMVLVDAIAPDAKDAEFVLKVHDVRRRLVDRAGGTPIALPVTLPDPPANLRAIGARSIRLVDRGSDATDRWVGRLYSGHEIGGECRDPAPARNRGGDKGDTHNTILRCHRCLDWQRNARRRDGGIGHPSGPSRTRALDYCLAQGAAAGRSRRRDAAL